MLFDVLKQPQNWLEKRLYNTQVDDNITLFYFSAAVSFMVAEQFGEAIEMEAITRAAKYGRMTGGWNTNITVRHKIINNFCWFRYLPPHGMSYHGRPAQDCNRLPGRV